MIESKHRSKLHALLNPSIYAMGLTGVYQNGVADAWYSGQSDLWCEHKRFVKCPKRLDLTNPRVTTPMQQQWLRDRFAEGRNVCMIVFTDEDGHAIFHGLNWQEPVTREDFLHLSMTRRDLAEYIIGYLGANSPEGRRLDNRKG